MQYPSEMTLLDLYRRMALVRRFEETVQRIYREGRMPGFVHLYIGEEAVVAGVTAHLTKADAVSSTHRGHAHAVGKGIPIKLLMAELFGRQDGLCGGRGGSMHFFSKEYNFLGCNGIVGYGVPIAAGAAYTAKYLGTGQIGVAFFGDGAVNLGVFHEVMNMAAIWKLPVVFVNENNLYATELSFTYAVAGGSIAARAAGYGIPGIEVDGQDVLAVYEAAGEAIARARSGEGPSLLECRTYRFVGHHEGDPGTGYRTQAEVELWKQRDPIRLFRQKLLENKLVPEPALDQLQEQIEGEIAQAVKFGEASPWPEAETVGDKVFASAI
jgi:acetoin:2,6-dichlorophenolindophenol oxidoreductase subunit alpha